MQEGRNGENLKELDLATQEQMEVGIALHTVARLRPISGPGDVLNFQTSQRSNSKEQLISVSYSCLPAFLRKNLFFIPCLLDFNQRGAGDGRSVCALVASDGWRAGDRSAREGRRQRDGLSIARAGRGREGQGDLCRGPLQAKGFEDTSVGRRMFAAFLARVDPKGAIELAKQLGGAELAGAMIISSVAFGIPWDKPAAADAFLNEYAAEKAGDWVTPTIIWKIASLDPAQARRIVARAATSVSTLSSNSVLLSVPRGVTRPSRKRRSRRALRRLSGQPEKSRRRSCNTVVWIYVIDKLAIDRDARWQKSFVPLAPIFNPASRDFMVDRF